MAHIFYPTEILSLILKRIPAKSFTIRPKTEGQFVLRQNLNFFLKDLSKKFCPPQMQNLFKNSCSNAEMLSIRLCFFADFSTS